MYPSLSSKYVHTLDIPETINHIKEIILKYKGEKKVWEMNIKHILESNKIISEVEYENPIINWNKIWNQIYMIKNSTHTHKKKKKKKKTQKKTKKKTKKKQQLYSDIFMVYYP